MSDELVAAQVRLTHHPVTNPMYPRPICDRDSEEWPCITELQVREGLRIGGHRVDVGLPVWDEGDELRTAETWVEP